MRLTTNDIPYPIPVMGYDPPQHPHGEAIKIVMPTADPKSLGLMPGMECDFHLDDGTVRRVKLGSQWTTQHGGAEVRIRLDPLPEPTAST